MRTSQKHSHTYIARKPIKRLPTPYLFDRKIILIKQLQLQLQVHKISSSVKYEKCSLDKLDQHNNENEKAFTLGETCFSITKNAQMKKEIKLNQKLSL